MHVRDTRAVAARNRDRIAAGEYQVPGVEQQRDVVAGVGHQPVDFGFCLHHGAHMVVKGKTHAALSQVVRHGVQFRAELRPRRIGEHGSMR